MMKYFRIEPEVAGGLGAGTVQDTRRDRPANYRVDRLVYQFDVWLGDEILEGTPCFIVTQCVADRIREAGLTGIVFDEVEITRSGIFDDMNPRRVLPAFNWMKIVGTKNQNDDFFIAEPRAWLVVSERAWDVIRPFATHAILTEFK